MTPGADGRQTGSDVATVETDLADLPHAWQMPLVRDPRLHLLSPRFSSWLGLICAHKGSEVRMVSVAALSPPHGRQLGCPFRVSHNVDWIMDVLTSLRYPRRCCSTQCGRGGCSRAVDKGLLHPIDLAGVEQASEVAVGGQAFHRFLLAELVSCVCGHVPNGQVEPRRQPVQRLGERF